MENRERKKTKSEIIELIKNKDLLMRLNKALSTKTALKIIAVIFFIFMFLICNYALNAFFNLPQFFKNSQNGFNYLGIQNAFVIDFNNGIAYLFIIVILVIADVKLIYNIRTSWKDNNVGQKGTERITKPEELVKQYKAIPEKGENFSGKGGLPVSWFGNKILIDDSAVNNLIIGCTRSGKGETIVFPMIDIYSRAEYKPSLIIADLKLELYPACKKTLEERGYEVHLLNLVNPVKSMGYNPLTPIIEAYKEERYDDAELLARNLGYSIFCNAKETSGENKFWDKSSAFAVQALILAHIDDCLAEDKKENNKKKNEIIDKYLNKLPAVQRKKQKLILGIHKLKNTQKENGEEYSVKEIAELLDRTPQTIKKYWNVEPIDTDKIIKEVGYQETHENEKKITLYSIVNTFAALVRVKVSSDMTALDVYFNERPDLDRAKFAYTSIEAAGDRTKGSIVSTTLSEINIFVSGGIAKMCAESSINLLDIGFGKKPMAVFLGIPPFDGSNTFVTSMFIKQTCFTLSKHAMLTSGKCDRQVIFLLDEFCNIPAIDDMDKYITAGLGLNIYFTLIIQNLNQLKTVYGEKAKTISGNCANTVYILTNEYDTAKQISETIGYETVTNINRQGKKMAVNKNFTEMYEQKPLINPNQLMHLKEGENIIIRPMKRKDLDGNDIESAPIFNIGQYRFKLRHKYMPEYFPSEVHLNEVLDETRENINLKDRIFNINKYFEKKEEERENKRLITDLENPLPIITWVTKKKKLGNKVDQLTVGTVKTMILNSKETDEEKNRLLQYLKDFEVK